MLLPWLTETKFFTIKEKYVIIAQEHPLKGGCFIMRITSIFKTAIIIGALGGLLWLGISKFDNVANDNASSAIDQRHAVEDTITDNGK